MFSHVAEAGGLYQPQYEVQGQPGAVYDITALEDIVTPDGVVHAKAENWCYPDHRERWNRHIGALVPGPLPSF